MFGDPPHKLPQQISYLLLPRFSLIGFSSLVDPLRWANTISGKELYGWNNLAVTGTSVESSDRIAVQVDGTINEIDHCQMLIVCAGYDPQHQVNPALMGWLRRQASHGALIGAQDTGSYILASAGLLNNYRATIHWENLQSFAEMFPQVKVVNDIFEIDRNRFSCSGGLSGLDMMLHLVQCQHGQDLASAIAEQLIYSQRRSAEHPQLLSLQARLGTTNPKLIAAIKIMRRNLEEPLSIPALAAEVHISDRELERLFRKHLQTTPGSYYRNLRLEQARCLLQQTSRSVTNIAVACGFSSSAHFSRSYLSRYGIAPSKDRQS
ncbi:GlxA family transcriptional regulator [Endozoicomonas sp. SM1973]|uniref:GlxA family transcriptional regulator n=1 Tax=Spartinivicinus marinus TaxID=2994442 RepID=A0A853HUV7_9GAMM|nr:GlxA family transcriptional regulator [Spartinivicinus marinus]MCX4029469.1 GlxA family transcriptional regulator [Spartinivicinus marinus]NYZ65043.1 GlxA family transcriptional regulator [Spartinivicinus marinus]